MVVGVAGCPSGGWSRRCGPCLRYVSNTRLTSTYPRNLVEPTREATVALEESLRPGSPARGGVAQGLLREGRPFAAHETYEVAWKHRPPHERELWHGMAQLCAGYTHAARGNTVGAARLVERARARLAAYVEGGGSTYGLDLPAILDEPEVSTDRA